MWTMIALLAVSAPAGQAVADDGVLTRMTALYDEVCLKTFPDDGAVAAAMTAKGAVVMKPAALQIYLHDDPGRGWTIADGDSKFTVTVEAPPYHACSVRRMTMSGFTDLAPYYAVSEPYERAAGGYSKVKPMDMQLGMISSHATGEQKVARDGSAESLFVFSNTPNDSAERAKGLTGVEVRFVHQFMSKDAR
ncbi:MAG: hypothetical protein ABI240_11495 [Sphingomonas sp.]